MEGKQKSVYFYNDTLELVDTYAKKHNRSVSYVINYLIRKNIMQ